MINGNKLKIKKIVYKNVDTKVNTKKFNIYNIFERYLNKDIDYDRIDMIERSMVLEYIKKDLVQIKIKAL